ncbi:cell division initiation protein [Streptomyces sp. 150FB]|uniref:cell division initiation protein n=1 Tax=Streptomyces sp. 150FB TaxID=1576605 RepID=UPI00058944D6|nr:cell division initiation protein [Streptomyces sp. 150FB]KIF76963.1 cell division initiation protein [Streptomyces sp. 150FB]
MDVQKKLDEIVDAVGNARSMPMSASCVVNRADLLAMLEEVREALPGSLAQAQEMLGGHEQLAEQARQEAERIIESAHAQRSTLISDTEVARQSQDEADRILAEARRDAEEIRAEADDYVDSKLANFEVVLTKTIGSVDRGREKLLGRAPGPDETYDSAEDDDAPEYSADPDTLIRRADDYVDAKLGAFEAVLSKTLDAVGRGRQKLHGRTDSDALGAHMAAQDAAGRQGHTSDEDFLADLAGTPRPGALRAAAEQAAVPDLPAVPDQVPDPVMAAGQQSYDGTDTGGYPAAVPGGYQDAGYTGTGYEGTGYTDPAYAEQPTYAPGYQQQDAYGYQQDPYAYQQQVYAQEQSQGQGQSYDQAYGWPQQPDAAQAQQPQQPQIPGQQSGLDETSLFDTSMIDLEQLRRYEQGH